MARKLEFTRHNVSPITIRLRILKVMGAVQRIVGQASFTHHDPLEDTERFVPTRLQKRP